MRTTRPQMFMEIAQAVARRSTCMRLNVGAVLVQGRSIVSIGYNGAPAGAPHCGGNDCPGKHHCRETIHAEVNALLHLPKPLYSHSLDDMVGLDLYVTDSPCYNCMAEVEESGRVNRIFFANPYRLTDHLKSDRIKIYRVLPAGFVVDWETKELVDVET